MRDPSSPNRRSSSKKRSSSAFVRCAVVRAVIPPPIGPSSKTITALPSRASKYAVVNPAMPAPIMQTSALVSLRKGDSDGVSAVAAQTDTVVPEEGCMTLPFRDHSCDLSAKTTFLINPDGEFGIVQKCTVQSQRVILECKCPLAN